jgi:ribosome maturation factor RimP
MALNESIAELITPAVEKAGFFLEEVHIATPGKHRIVTCIVDGEAPLNLDQVTSVSRDISVLLDEAPFMGETPFTLEVTSPGVDRPLTKPRHFKKNKDRLLRIVKTDGTVTQGRIKDSSESAVTLTDKDVDIEVNFGDIKKALVEIEFNRKGDL